MAFSCLGWVCQRFLRGVYLVLSNRIIYKRVCVFHFALQNMEIAVLMIWGASQKIPVHITDVNLSEVITTIILSIWYVLAHYSFHNYLFFIGTEFT